MGGYSWGNESRLLALQRTTESLFFVCVLPGPRGAMRGRREGGKEGGRAVLAWLRSLALLHGPIAAFQRARGPAGGSDLQRGTLSI